MHDDVLFLTNLTCLCLLGNQGTNSGIENLVNLRKLDITDGITYEALSKLPILDTLVLHGDFIDGDFSLLSNLTSLSIIDDSATRTKPHKIYK